MKNLLSISKKTKELLNLKPRLRDNRTEFIVNILCENGVSRVDAEATAENYKIAATADRCWRRTQQLFPLLRGKFWGKRQEKQEEVKESLGYKRSKE